MEFRMRNYDFDKLRTLSNFRTELMNIVHIIQFQNVSQLLQFNQIFRLSGELLN